MCFTSFDGFDFTFITSMNVRVEALPPLVVYNDKIPGVAQTFDISIKEHRGLMKKSFIESFKRFVDFNAQPLNPDDLDFAEFANDPRVPLLKFVKQIMKATGCPFSVLAGAIVLLRRLLQMHKNLVVSIDNMHRIMLITILIADKFLEDIPCGNDVFAEIMKMSVESISELELEFLCLLKYSPFISLSEIEQVLNSWGFSIGN